MKTKSRHVLWISITVSTAILVISAYLRPRVETKSSNTVLKKTLSSGGLNQVLQEFEKAPKIAKESSLPGVTQSSAIQALEGNQIPFKVVGGLAVAYGDIILGAPEDPNVKQGIHSAPTPELWDRGEIPYFIASDFPNPERVRMAIEHFQKNSNVSFVPYDGQKDALVFEVGEKNCLSQLGRNGGLQPIRLSEKCTWHEVTHEIMHSLGFVHEHSRPDRGRYIEILWDNIDSDYAEQFAVVPETFMEAARGSSFDYRSSMLYPPTLFAAKPGLATMISKTGSPISPSVQGLSREDIQRLNRLYPK